MGRVFSRRETFRRLGVVGLSAAAGVSVVSACAKDLGAGARTDDTLTTGPVAARESGDAGRFAWPPGLVALWDFQDDPKGGNTVTSRVGELVTLIARDAKTVVKDSVDPGPFGPSLVLDGETVFVKDGDIGGLDVTTNGGTQVTVIDWVNDTAGNHDDMIHGVSANGIAFRAGSHCEGGPEAARQYGSYFDDQAYLGWSHGHYTPRTSPQDGPSPGYPFNHEYAGSARKVFTSVGQGQWHMEAFTYDGEKITAFIDGLADEWKAVPEPAPWVPGFTMQQIVDRNPFFVGKPINNSPTMKRFSIGAAIYGGAPYQGVNFTTGKLGGVAVFNRALSAEEIMAVRIGTLRPGEPITMYSFEVTAPGPQALNEIGWTATAGADNADVSAALADDYRVSRPNDATKAFLRKASSAIGTAWVPLTGLSSTQVKHVRFKLLSEKQSSASQRILAKVGDQWWASDVAYSTTKDHPPNDTDWSQADTATHTMSWERGQWKPVTLQPGVLKMDDAANSESIAPGPLNAIGFLSEGGDRSIARIADLELFANYERGES